jgi:hypothetical protein
MSELINRWFGRAARVPGMLACGLRHADGTTYSRAWEASPAEPLLNELWPRLTAIAEAAGGEAPELLRWTFDKHVVVAAPRPNGPTFFILLVRKTGEDEDAGVERLLQEFRALRG